MSPTPGDGVRRRAVLSAASVALGSLAGCSGVTGVDGGTTASPTTESGTALSGDVAVAGSSTVYPITLEVANRFMDDHPEVSVSVSSTGTGGGFADFFCPGKTDVNDASRPISEAEMAACAANGVDPVPFRVATDALTVVVNTAADWLDCVRPAELAAIWREDGAERWADVNEAWPDEPIELYGPTSASGTFDYFAERVLGDVETHRTDYTGTEQDNTIVQSVADSRYAMGYLGFAYYRRNADRVAALSIRDGDDDCVAPSLDAARTGRYRPLSRPLFIYVDRAALDRAVVRAFVAAYLEAAPSDLVREVGYVPVSEAEAASNWRRFDAATGG